MNFKNKFQDLILDSENKIDLYKAPYNAIYETYKQPCKKCNRNLNVAIIAAPCNGFGDIVFASKFAKYIKFGLTPNSLPLSNKVTIITPTKNMFLQLGVKDIDFIELKSISSTMQCRRLRNFTISENLKKFDLIFVAPLMSDFKIDYSDVKKLLPESTPFNTIFVSEYGDDLDKGFDIVTGVGPDYDGILFDGLKPAPKLKELGTTPYALGYLAKDVGIAYCLSNFVKLIISKYYKKHQRLNIVLPEWSVKQLEKNKTIQNFIKNYYPNIISKTKNETVNLKNGDGGTLTFRGDIFPVPRDKMMSLMKYSVADILVTGDQSVTDVIDCCSNKTIWYQTVPWKKEFSQDLSTELNNKYLFSSKTSCGTLKAINWKYKSNNFKERNDFRKKSKHLLESIFRSISESKIKNSLINKYLKQLGKSTNKELLSV